MAVKASLSITQNSQSISGNYSSVTVKVKVSWTAGSWDHYSQSCWVKINGTKYNFTRGKINPNNTTSGSQTLYTKTVNVTHNADGTKKLSCSCYVRTGTSSGNVSASASKTLTTIPRASSLTVPSFTIGSANTITVSRVSSSFTHTITVKFASYSSTIVTKGTALSYSFTPSIDWCKGIPNNASGTATFTISTYNGSTLIGSKSYSSTFTVPSSIIPTVTIDSISDGGDGTFDKFGFFIKSKSKAKFTITASSSYGATIKSYATKFNNETLSGATPISSIINGSGTLTATVTVTDSRGRTKTVTENIEVHDYNAPTMGNITCDRSDSSGNIIDEGENLRIYLKYNITPLNNLNDNFYKIEYKKSNDPDTSYQSIMTGSGYEVDSVLISDALFSADYAYTIKVTVGDYFTSISREVDIPTAFTLYDCNISGKGISFGRVSNQDGFIVDMDYVEIKAVEKLTMNNACYIDGVQNEGNIITSLIGLSSNNNIVIGSSIAERSPNAIHIYADSANSEYALLRIINHKQNDKMLFQINYDTTGQFIASEIIRDRLYSYSQSQAIVTTSYGTLGRAGSSSRKYKTDIISIDDNLSKQQSPKMARTACIEKPIDPHGIYGIPIMQYKYVDGYLSHDDVAVGKDLIGIMAEDVAEHYPIACVKGENGEAEAWSQEPVVVGLMYLVQEQKKKIEDLKEDVEFLKREIEALKG